MKLASLLGWPLLASIVPLLAGCAASSLDSAPFLWPTPFSADPPSKSFSVRYSEVWNSQEEVLALIRRQCGPETTTARVFEQPYLGSLTHPQQYQRARV